MDAYDIFKKLTRGLKFKHKILGVKNNEFEPKANLIKKDKDEELEFKQEELSENENILEVSENEENENKEDSEDSTFDKDEELQFIDGVKVGKKKRIKKQKEKPEDLKKKLELEEHNHFRNEHGIKAVGRHIPAALKDFEDLISRYNVQSSMIDTVVKSGYNEPTPVQRQALPCMLEDRQILACAPTGSGKTAAFLLPILHMLGAPQGGPRALILCPTRELAAQIHREALRLSASKQLRCSVLRSIKMSKVKEREATFRKSDIVITTPNRLCYLLNQDTVNITLEKIRWLIIDEADKLFEGSADQESDFRQQLDQIMTACGHKQRRVAMFSATHTPAVAKWCRHNMRGLINITVGQRNAATDLVDQELLYCGNESGKLLAFRQLVQKGLKPPVLVFVQSKDRAKQLFKELIYDGINVDVIHADRTQTQKIRDMVEPYCFNLLGRLDRCDTTLLQETGVKWLTLSESCFVRDNKRDNVVRSFRVGRIWVLICTELMGRGIDFRGVNLVVNYDFPPSAISYIHRIGRAGRAGQRGRAITFFTQDDVANLRSIAAVMKQSGCEVPEYMLKLKQNPNKRKKLMKKAPHRDSISTILGKRPDKRKLEEIKETENISKNTKQIKSGKERKQRKIQNGVKNDKDKKIKGNHDKKMKKIKKKTVLHKKAKVLK